MENTCIAKSVLIAVVTQSLTKSRIQALYSCEMGCNVKDLGLMLLLSKVTDWTGHFANIMRLFEKLVHTFWPLLKNNEYELARPTGRC